MDLDLGQDLPPAQLQELVGALTQSGLDSSVGEPGSRRMSDVATPSLAVAASAASTSKTPRRLPLTSVIERAQRLDAVGTKRAAELDSSEFRDSQASAFEQAPPVEEPSQTADALVVSKEDIFASLGDPSVHPLVHIYHGACLDRMRPLESRVNDHGSWHGRWHLPSRSEWETRSGLGLSWPTGSDDVENSHEACAVQAARKEYHWKSMNDEQKVKFREAAEQAWSVWADNEAVEVLDEKQSARIRQRLKDDKEVDFKVLTPRYVFTDKHEPLRTADNPLELKARARIVVPGFRDVLSFSIRKDAPTASRISQHMLLIMTASYKKAKKAWRLLSADVKSAFMKGDPFAEGSRELYMQNMSGAHGEPLLPFPRHCLARIRKGVFGLSDAPRLWYLRLHKEVTAMGWGRSSLDHACWVLWSEDRKTLHGILLALVDDLLLGGDQRAQESLLSLGKSLGFGSIEYDDFVYCGKRIRQLEDGTIAISMEEYHQNPKPRLFLLIGVLLLMLS